MENNILDDLHVSSNYRKAASSGPSPPDQVLQEVHSMIGEFFSSDLRTKLNLQKPDEAPSRAPLLLATELEQLKEENRRLREEVEAISGPSGKRKRLMTEGPCVAAWEKRRGQEELEHLKAAHERERAQWQSELRAVDLERQKLIQNVKFMQLQLEDKASLHAKAQAAASQEIDVLRRKIADITQHNYHTSGDSVRDAHETSAERRRLEYLEEQNASLAAKIATIQMETEGKMDQLRAVHEKALQHAEHQLEEQKALQRSAQQAFVGASPQDRSHEEISLQREVAELRRQLSERNTLPTGITQSQARESELVDHSQVVMLRRKLEESEKQLKDAASAIAECEIFRQQKLHWEKLFSAELVPRGESSAAAPQRLQNGLPAKVYEALRHTRKEEIKYKELHGRSEARLREMEAEIDNLRRSLQEARTASERDKQELRLRNDELTSAQHSIKWKDSAVKRRDDLLSTYESNEQKPGRLSDDQRLAKESLMQAEFAAKDNEICELRAKLASVVTQESYRASEARATELEQQLGEKASEIVKLERVLERVETELFALKSAVSTGEKTASTTKIIHMPNNPATQAAADRRAELRRRLEQLEEENANLKNKVQQLDGASLPSDGASMSTSSLSNANYEQQLAQTRLADMFRKNVEQYKHVVRCLFGYELVFSPGLKNGYRVKLLSDFAEREDDLLEFAWEDEENDGKIDVSEHPNLIETRFALQLNRDNPKLFEFYLERCRSIPLFLAEVSRHLWSNSTNALG